MVRLYYSNTTMREQTIAFTDEERTRIIDAFNQPCEQFAIHPDCLPSILISPLQRIYTTMGA
jgi:hypothetical protein